MALFDQYTKPGVYTRETVDNPGAILFGDLRIPIFVGEGTEEVVASNVTLHRGSSSAADDLIVKENFSDQLYDLNGDPLAPTRTFHLTYYPVVKGDGTGTVTNLVTDVIILANDVPVVVTSLNGVTGEIMLHDLMVAGTSLTATYYFKKMDTEFFEDISTQVPAYATWVTQPNMVVTLSNPGALGNQVTLSLVATTPTSDALAVSGIGTDAIVIELKQSARVIAYGIGLTFNTDKTITRATGSWITEGVKVGDTLVFTGLTTSGNNKTVTVASVNINGLVITVNEALTTATIDAGGTATFIPMRTLTDIQNLVLAGIATLSSGSLVVSSITAGHELDGAVVSGSATFSGGSGPASNTTFKVKHTPIVDGSNGGVVTSSVQAVTATVNGVTVALQSIDGPNGLVTFANPIAFGQTPIINYFSNNYQDTFEILPSSNVASISLVGYGPDRADFVEGVNYVLETNEAGSKIQWGASASTTAGTWTAGFTPLDASHIVTTLVDEKVFMQPVTGLVNGKNSTFILPDAPMDSSGLSRITDDPSLVQVYVGSSIITALAAGPVRVTQVVGATRTVKLYNPPTSGIVFASYYRNRLSTSTYTLTVVTPGVTDQGTYNIKNSNGVVIPAMSLGVCSVFEAGFHASGSGVVWPYGEADLAPVAGSTPNETITVTFQDDELYRTVTNSAQAFVVGSAGSNSALMFKAVTPGTGANVVTIQLVSAAGADGASAITGAGTNTLTVNIVKVSTSVRTLQEILDLVNAYPAAATSLAGGVIICEQVSGTGISLSIQAAASPVLSLAGGVNLVQTKYSNRFKVTSSRGPSDVLADGLGITGGATTPALANWTGPTAIPLGTTGYLNQTYNDINTGVKFTLINPADANALIGSTPIQYHFVPGDTLTFLANSATPRATSALPTTHVLGLKTKVVSTYGMRAADTATLKTYNMTGGDMMEPAIGDYYYVTYSVAKTDTDMELRLYTNPADAYAQYGAPTPTNKLSLAARLFAENGGGVFGCLQIRKEVGLETASDNSFKAAISSLAAPLPGTDRKCDMIQPTTTSPVVIQHLNRHLLTQSSQRNSGEATSVYGFDLYATPTTMKSSARSVRSDRMTGVAIPGAIIEINVDGKSSEFAVGGEFVAAAMAGMIINPAIDVATTLTRQNMVGFTRLIKRYDDPTMDLMAAEGLTCLVERDGAFQVRHWVTTDNSSVLKREPTSRLIVDYTRRMVRKNLDQFIGRKLLQTALNSISIVTSSTLTALVEQEIIEGYKNLLVESDAADPTVVHVKFAMKPIFSLLWIDCSLTVSTKL